MANYDGFLVGSQVIQPLVNNNNLPLDAKSVAQNKAEVLAKLDQGGRYIGLYIYCIDEAKIYVFKDGIEDSDFVPLTDGDGGSVGTIGDNPTSIHYELCDETDDGALKVVGMVQDPLTEILITEVEDIANIGDFVKLVKSNSTDVYKYIDDKLDDTKVGNTTTYSSEKIENLIDLNVNNAKHIKYIKCRTELPDPATTDIDRTAIYLLDPTVFGGTEYIPYMYVQGAWKRIDSANLELENLSYSHDYLLGYGVSNAKNALDTIVEKVFYVEPKITIFRATPSENTYEVGDVIDSISFEWAYNKKITSQTLTDCVIADANTTTATYDTPLTESKTFTLTGIDEKGSVVKQNHTILFIYKTYYGTSGEIPTISDNVVNLANNKLLSKVGNVKYTCNNEYLVYAYPKSYGVLKSIKDPNKFENISDFDITEITVTTDKNSTDYYVYTSKSKKTLTDFEYTFSWL